MLRKVPKSSLLRAIHKTASNSGPTFRARMLCELVLHLEVLKFLRVSFYF